MPDTPGHFDGALADAARKILGPDGPLARAANGRPAVAMEIMDAIFDGHYLMLQDETIVHECEPGFLRRALDSESIVHNLIRFGLVRCVWSDEHTIHTPHGHQPVYPLTITSKGATVSALWHTFSPDTHRS